MPHNHEDYEAFLMKFRWKFK